KKVLELSLGESRELGHDYIGTEHILLGLIREGEGVAAQVLQQLGADLNRVRQQVIRLVPDTGFDPDVVITGVGIGGKRFLGNLSDPAHTIVELAAASARDLGHGSIEPSDLLLGLIAGADDTVWDLLASWGVDLDAVRARIEELAAEEEDDEGSE